MWGSTKGFLRVVILVVGCAFFTRTRPIPITSFIAITAVSTGSVICVSVGCFVAWFSCLRPLVKHIGNLQQERNAAISQYEELRAQYDEMRAGYATLSHDHAVVLFRYRTLRDDYDGCLYEVKNARAVIKALRSSLSVKDQKSRIIGDVFKSKDYQKKLIDQLRDQLDTASRIEADSQQKLCFYKREKVRNAKKIQRLENIIYVKEQEVDLLKEQNIPLFDMYEFWQEKDVRRKYRKFRPYFTALLKKQSRQGSKNSSVLGWQKALLASNASVSDKKQKRGLGAKLRHGYYVVKKNGGGRISRRNSLS